LRSAERLIWRTQTGLDKTPCINRTLAVHDPVPEGHEDRWIKTIPGKGWFVYFRIYGPEPPAFDCRWKPGDFEEVK
jgi:hypothetical protein